VILRQMEGRVGHAVGRFPVRRFSLETILYEVR
jgi:hypothetical protein